MSAGRTVNSQSQDWCTPPKYVKAILEMFNGNIELDPCSNTSSVVDAKIEYIFPQHDGLIEIWDFKTIYVNPPYGVDRARGTTIKHWLKKCAEAHKEYDSEVLALVPVATNTSHWKDYVFGEASAICFLYDTRLKFLVNNTTNNKGAPMSCCMVYWGHKIKKFRSIFLKFGAVVNISDLLEHQIGYYRETSQISLFRKEENDSAIYDFG